MQPRLVSTALIQSDGGFPGEIERLADVTFPVFMAQSDVDALFPPETVMPQFAAIPTPKYLLVLHDALPRDPSVRTPRQPPTRPTQSPPRCSGIATSAADQTSRSPTRS